MLHRRRVKPDVEVLPEPAAAQLLARASELDAARRASATVSELRAAAAEAGISTGAFDAALGELQEAERRSRVPDVRGRHRRRAQTGAIAAAVAALIAAGGLALTERLTPTGAAAPMVEETVLLRCLAPEEAAELIRPLLIDGGTVVVSPSRAPRMLTVRATLPQMEKVRSTLDQYEGPGSAACGA